MCQGHTIGTYICAEYQVSVHVLLYVIVYIIVIITNIITAFVKGELNIVLWSRYLIKSTR